MTDLRLELVLAAVIALLVATAASAAPPPIPTPIGVGAQYRPTAVSARVRAGRPFGAHRCAVGGRRYGVHVELFANRRVVIVPAGIGVAAPVRLRGADVVPGGCSYAVRTLTPTGVVEVRRGTELTLGDLFQVWSRRLGGQTLLGFRGPVSVFVDGRRWRHAPRTVPLRRHAEIVVEIGGYVPPHATFLFPRGL
jgi:hypothetical protein